MNLDLDKLLKEKFRPASIKVIKSNYQNLLQLLKTDKLNFKDIKAIEKVLEGRKEATIRNYLTSIISILASQEKPDTKLIDQYKEIAEKYDNIVKNHRESFTKSEKQEKNWLTLQELKNIMKENLDIVKANKIIGKTRLSKNQYDLYMNYLVPALYLTTSNNPPRRTDYANMKIISTTDYEKLSKEEQQNHNWWIKKNKTNSNFQFNIFKTSDKYEGGQNIPVDKKLNNILNKWQESNPSQEWLLPKYNGSEHITSEGLAKILKRAFRSTGKIISINMIRNIFISHHFEPIDPERTKIAHAMGHQVSTSLGYSKN